MADNIEPTDDQLNEISAEIRETALRARDELLGETILALIPYLEPDDMDGVSFQHMENELSESAIEKAKERMLRDLQFRIAKRMIADSE